MGWSTHHPTGLIYCALQHCYRGYTLITNSRGQSASLVDLQGRICHRWHCPEGISYAYLLPHGHLLLRTNSGPPVEVSFLGAHNQDGRARPPGVSDAVLELDWDSNLVWAYRHPMLHHDFERLPNGNTLVLLWEEMPARLAAQVQGGFKSDGERAKTYSPLSRSRSNPLVFSTILRKSSGVVWGLTRFKISRITSVATVAVISRICCFIM